jgi:hypothetical protein
LPCVHDPTPLARRPTESPQHTPPSQHVELLTVRPTRPHRARPLPCPHRLPRHEIAQQSPQLRIPQHQQHVFGRPRSLPRGPHSPCKRCVCSQQRPLPFGSQPPIAQRSSASIHTSKNDDITAARHGRGAVSARRRTRHGTSKGPHVERRTHHHVCNRPSVLRSAKPHLAAMALALRNPDSELCEGALDQSKKKKGVQRVLRQRLRRPGRRPRT